MGEKISNNKKLLFLLGLIAIFFASAFIFTPSLQNILGDYKNIYLAPSILDFDALAMTEFFGTSFFNAGLTGTAALCLFIFTKADISGISLAAFFMLTGFSFYGKNIINIIFPIAGVLLFAILSKQELKKYAALAIFATSVSPIFSVLAFGTETLPSFTALSIIIGAVFATFAGFMVGLLAGYFGKLVGEYALFTAGFTATFVAMMINSLLKVIGLGHEKFPYTENGYTSGKNGVLSLFLLAIFVYMIVFGMLNGGLDGFKRLMKNRALKSHMEEYGFYASMMNMGALGILGTLFILATLEGQLGGTIIAPIFTLAGFGAVSINLFAYLPILITSALTSFLTGGLSGAILGTGFLPAAIARLSSRGMMASALFSGGITPLVQKKALPFAIIIASVHTLFVANISVLHGWMSLYNNGFSLIFFVILLRPLYETYLIKKKIAL